jgi:hypothetical protein
MKNGQALRQYFILFTDSGAFVQFPSNESKMLNVLYGTGST